MIGGVLSFAMEFRYDQQARCCQQGRRATNRNHVLHVAKLNEIGFVASRQETLLLRFGVGDLVDDQSDTALGDDVGGAVTQLNGDNRMCCLNFEHGEQIHYRIGAS